MLLWNVPLQHTQSVQCTLSHSFISSSSSARVRFFCICTSHWVTNSIQFRVGDNYPHSLFRRMLCVNGSTLANLIMPGWNLNGKQRTLGLWSIKIACDDSLTRNIPSKWNRREPICYRLWKLVSNFLNYNFQLFTISSSDRTEFLKFICNLWVSFGSRDSIVKSSLSFSVRVVINWQSMNSIALNILTYEHLFAYLHSKISLVEYMPFIYCGCRWQVHERAPAVAACKWEKKTCMHIYVCNDKKRFKFI